MEEVEGRSCEGCTKCCEGYLAGDIRGHWMGLDENNERKPCFFVQQGIGCGDYENRPSVPCKVFKCEWLTNPNVPESFKPSRSGAIFSTRTVDGIEYLKLLEADDRKKLDSEVLSWAIEYTLSNGINFAWRVQKNIFWLGSEEFNIMMDRDYPMLGITNADGESH